MNTNDGSEVIAAFEDANQPHVFRFWSDLDEVERKQLLSQASQIDLLELKNALRQALEQKRAPSLSLGDLEPAPWVSLPMDPQGELKWKEAKAIGEELLHAGKVVAFTVAGGQGTRLGYNGPKGACPVTPLTNKSLFQVFAEKLKVGHRRYGRNLDWVVMTSEVNHEQTKGFFKKHNYFGLDPNGVRLLPQGMMPAVLDSGEIILETKSRIAMNPDGHGGVFRVLAKSGLAKELQEAGTEVITYFQVDNPLAPFLEPEFLGFHTAAGSEMSSRAAPKKSPDEKVGVFCLRNGTLSVIEYSDLPDQLAQCRAG
ncbi:MAG: UTP--glucose-1-phosphate uridylyltransferase, partial [Opitutales bacterium]